MEEPSRLDEGWGVSKPRDSGRRTNQTWRSPWEVKRDQKLTGYSEVPATPCSQCNQSAAGQKVSISLIADMNKCSAEAGSGGLGLGRGDLTHGTDDLYGIAAWGVAV